MNLFCERAFYIATGLFTIRSYPPKYRTWACKHFERSIRKSLTIIRAREEGPLSVMFHQELFFFQAFKVESEMFILQNFGLSYSITMSNV